LFYFFENVLSRYCIARLCEDKRIKKAIKNYKQDNLVDAKKTGTKDTDKNVTLKAFKNTLA